MFVELMPLIERRALTITVAVLDGKRIRINVVPRTLHDDSKVNETMGYANQEKIAQIPETAVQALTTPLCLSGTPEEIDAELAGQLRSFVESHLSLQQSVDQAKQQIAEAVRAIEEREKNQSKSKSATARSEDSGTEDRTEESKFSSGNPSLFEGKDSPAQLSP